MIKFGYKCNTCNNCSEQWFVHGLQKLQKIWKYREELLKIKNILDSEDMWWLIFDFDGMLPHYVTPYDWLELHKTHQVIAIDENYEEYQL